MKSTFPDVHIPNVTVHEIILETMDMHGDRVALVNGLNHELLTYKETKKLVLRLASSLHDHGLKKGDTLAFFLPNCPEYVIFMFGAMCLGVTITVANPLYSKYELCRQLKDSGATFMFTSENLADKARNASHKVTSLREIFVVGEAAGCTSFRTMTEYDGPLFDFSKVPINPAEDVAFLPYSSGTTGLPKGVMLTHTNMLCNMYLMENITFEERRRGPQEVFLGVLPFYHIGGLRHIFIHLAHGGKLITMPRFQPRPFLQLIERYKVTSAILVPTLALFLLQSPLVAEYDLSSLSVVGCGGAPLGIAQEEALSRKLSNFGQVYGMTETTSLCTGGPPGKIRLGSIGLASPNTETQVVDPTSGNSLGPNQPGELLVRGPQVMKGYLNQPEETRKTLDENGWLHTGDLVYYDDDGFFYLVDRIKEFIKYKGYQVSPAELETLLMTHPDIHDVGVTWIPHETAGEAPFAFVVKAPGSCLTEQDVHAFVADKVATYKQLSGGVKFIKEVPRNNSGKILRKALKDLVATEGPKASKL